MKTDKAKTFDLIVIGTGPAASTVSKKTAESGRSVAVVEARDYGGTCALRGCNPKKVYTNASNLLDRAWGANGKLATFNQPAIDWSELLKFKREFTEPVRESSEGSYQKLGIETFHGTARFSGPESIQVGDLTLSGQRIFIGTGAMPAPLDIDGAEFITHSDEFLELEHMPPRVLFIGGGYISMEFSQLVARYGSSVCVVDHHPRPLKHFDPDLVDQLVEHSAQFGIEFVGSSKVEAIRKTADGALEVTVSKSNRTPNGSDAKKSASINISKRTIAADLVVHGAGRIPNIAALNLDAANIQHNQRGIEVDQCMRSKSNPRVFVGGDCADTQLPRLTPVANEQARVVVKALWDEACEHQPDYGAIPQVAFTTPCLAAVGLSEWQAREQFDDIDVRSENTSDWGSVRKDGQACAGYKVIIDPRTDRILGAHLLGPAADETINLFALAMKFDLTASDIKSTLFAFPTFASDVRRML